MAFRWICVTCGINKFLLFHDERALFSRHERKGCEGFWSWPYFALNPLRGRASKG